MKIGVIGTINRDTIHLPDGTIRKGWGGIIYNLQTLSKLVGDHDEITPVCNVGDDCFRQVTSVLKRLPGVRLDCIKRVVEKNNHCLLTYTDAENKREILAGGVPLLKFDDVKPLLDSDAILMNYISGRDIHLRSLQKLRRLFGGKIYIDIHSLTLGKRKSGERFLRAPISWPKVIECADFIQMNRLELKLLAGGPPENDIYKIFKRLVSNPGKKQQDFNRKLFVVTAGIKGCYLFSKSGPRWNFEHIPPFRKITGVDTTGCGDCFSGGFIFGLIQKQNLKNCCRMGNSAAAHHLMSLMSID